jgi:hypothetical protein
MAMMTSMGSGVRAVSIDDWYGGSSISEYYIGMVAGTLNTVPFGLISNCLVIIPLVPY